MMKKKIHISWFYLLLVANILLSQKNQQAIIENLNEDASFVFMDVSYINDAVFMGRRDSIPSPYIYPSIGYYDILEFFVDASVSYLVNPNENRFDLFLGSIGYRSHDKKVNIGISGTVYFFKEDSNNLKSSVGADISRFLIHDVQLLEVFLMASTYFNDDSSANLFAWLQLDRTFYNRKYTLLANPSVAVYSGSQFFYQEYYNTRRLVNRKGQDNGQGNSVSELSASTLKELQGVSSFSTVNIELSSPLQYCHKKFNFSLTPLWAIPQSIATVSLLDSLIKEDFKSVFVGYSEISYWFQSKKNSDV